MDGCTEMKKPAYLLELESVESEMESLKSEIGRLRARLDPLLAPSNPTTSPDTEKEPVPRSEVANRLRTIRADVVTCVCDLRELHDRVN